MTERPQGGATHRERARVRASEVLWGVRELQLAQAEVDRALAGRLALRALDYVAMTHVLAADPPLGPVQLAGRLGISTGSGTELADRLERAGHLHRRPADDDRRRVVLEPDEESAARIVGQLAPLLAELEQLAATLSPAEQEAVATFLRGAAERARAFAQRLDRG